ncbi:MAG: aldose epimerase family protein [Chloroflexota bacterium]
MPPSISRQPFGTAGGRPVERWTLDNGFGLAISALTLGAALQQVRALDRFGERGNVTLGFPDTEEYLVTPSPFFGVVAGRFANRIAGGRFTLDGRAHALPCNDGPNTLHGGPDGFDRRAWTAEDASGNGQPAVRFSLVSPDGDQGFPGELRVSVTYLLTADDALDVHYEAAADAPTVVNLTQHAYWNLEGENSGSALGHLLRVRASRYLPVNAAMIPTGELAPVAGTPFDFTAPHAIEARIRDGHPQLALAGGYDHTLVFDDPAAGPVIELEAPVSGRLLEIGTTEPGVQLYSGNFLDGRRPGIGGTLYRAGDGICLETHHFPDSPNQPAFPSTVLRPGETRRSRTRFRFSVVP